MNLYSTNEAVNTILKLEKKPSHKSIRKLLFDYFDKEIKNSGAFSGKRLNPPSSPYPFVKKRVEGSGGYRIYFYLFIKDSQFVLSAIHPKTSAYSKSTLTVKEIHEAQKSCIKAKNENRLIKIILNTQKTIIEFEK